MRDRHRHAHGVPARVVRRRDNPRDGVEVFQGEEQQDRTARLDGDTFQRVHLLGPRERRRFIVFVQREYPAAIVERLGGRAAQLGEHVSVERHRCLPMTEKATLDELDAHCTDVTKHASQPGRERDT